MSAPTPIRITEEPTTTTATATLVSLDPDDILSLLAGEKVCLTITDNKGQSVYLSINKAA